jgi:LmbE family N-acetylglucosaminyl deacetylase
VSATAPPDVVVLSPHLDDAVLSIGATIGRLAHQGLRVEVWTVYTAGPPLAAIARRHRAFGDYEIRAAEDDSALARLGAGHRRLGLRERIWRAPRPRSLASAFRTPSDVAGFGEVPRLISVVREVLARPGVELYAPLGVGHHVDHVEVALAVLTATIEAATVEAATSQSDAFARVSFYEDFYALGEAARRRHPITRRQAWPLSQVPGWAAPLGGTALRLGAMITRGPGLGDYLPAVEAMTWVCEPAAVEEFEDAKLAAIAEYRSQVPRLGGMSRIEALNRRAHRVRGGELLWRAVL